MADIVPSSAQPPVSRAVEARSFEALQKLTRQGYVPDPHPAEDGGILFRHDSAPDLILFADGRIELPSEQPLKRTKPALLAAGRRVSWRRALTFLLALIAYTIVSAIIVINLVAD